VRIAREVVDSALEDGEWKRLGMLENVALHTFVMPYPASVLSGIRSMMLAPEDMKINLAPFGMNGTQAWKRARDPRVYQGSQRTRSLERASIEMHHDGRRDEHSTKSASGRRVDAWTCDEGS
jgi:hypothetical protein